MKKTSSPSRTSLTVSSMGNSVPSLRIAVSSRPIPMIFGSRVLTHPMVKSTAIADAGLTKQTLYEVERQQFTRGTYDRAIEALDLVNGEIEGLIKQAWARS